ncbi:hypothetical protein ACFYZJ_10160 [Streptomyces sp. NPDC001848]|uniref:hypothetical protein n=1 Tax=Streptomyces sp. NPDC001848 TaxID=3364618 RepID=UPI003674B817
MRKHVVSGLAAAVLATGLAVVPAGIGSAASGTATGSTRTGALATTSVPNSVAPMSCSSTRRYDEGWGEAYYTVCSDGVSAQVYDRKADGKCVAFYVEWKLRGGGTLTQASRKACPKGHHVDAWYPRPSGGSLKGVSLLRF